MDPTSRAVDVAIIGGGIVGASLAWHLARRGAGRVALFEQRTVAAGASGRTGALLRRHYTNRPEAILAQEGWRVFRNWPEIVGGGCGFVQSGVVVPIPNHANAEANLAKLERNVAMQRALGVDAQVLAPAELSQVDPLATGADIAAAAWEPDSGYVDAVAATRGMAAAAARAGAAVHENMPVRAIVAGEDRVTGIETAAGFVPAGAVVCAAGPWSPALLAPLGVRVPITALRVQVAILIRPLAAEPPHAAYVDLAAGIFCRPWGPGRTMVGIGGGDQHDPVDPDRYEERTDADYPALARAALARRFPSLAGSSPLAGHAGLYDLTPDAHPIIDRAGPDGLYLAAGFSGAGFKKGPAVGQALAELILDGAAALLDLAPFRLARFADEGWRRPWSDNEYDRAADFGHKL